MLLGSARLPLLNRETTAAEQMNATDKPMTSPALWLDFAGAVRFHSSAESGGDRYLLGADCARGRNDDHTERTNRC